MAPMACMALQVVPAMAQSDEALAAARRTFAEGVADESAKRFEAALEEFRRVAGVKETANVRYRIASCLEALGHRAEALASFEAVMRLGEGDSTAADAVRESRERAAQLDRIIARLTITLSTPPPSGAQLRVDGVPVDLGALGEPIRLDPGPHSITAAAPGVAPFRTGVTLLEGSRLTLTVDLAPLAGAEALGAPAPLAVQTPRLAAVGGYIALGIGGALAVGSVVSFVLRASNLATLDRDCPPGTGDTLSCPQSLAPEVNRAHDAARVEGPLGIGLAVGAAVAMAAGVWLVVKAAPGATPSSARQGLRVGPLLVAHGGGIVLSDSL